MADVHENGIRLPMGKVYSQYLIADKTLMNILAN